MTDTTPPLAPLLQAMKAVMEEVKYVQKDSYNSGQKYNFVSEAGLIEKLRPAMQKHGLLLFPSVCGIPEFSQLDTSKGGKVYQANVTVEYTLFHMSGVEYPYKIRMAGSGQDYGDKAIYKALTGANKYLLFKLFQIATGDDPEKVEPEPEVKYSDQEITDICKRLDDAHLAGTLEEDYRANYRDWKRIATPPQFKKIEAKKDELKNQSPPVPDLEEKMLDDLETAFDVDGEKGLRDWGAKLIEANKSLEEAVNANVNEIIRRGRL